MCKEMPYSFFFTIYAVESGSLEHSTPVSSTNADYASRRSPAVTSSASEQRYMKPRSYMLDRGANSPGSASAATVTSTFGSGGGAGKSSLQVPPSGERYHSSPSPGNSRSATHAHSPAASSSGRIAYTERPGSRSGYESNTKPPPPPQPHRATHVMPPVASTRTDHRATTTPPRQGSAVSRRGDDSFSSSRGSDAAGPATSSRAGSQTNQRPSDTQSALESTPHVTSSRGNESSKQEANK